jgi:hypothetical protein
MVTDQVLQKLLGTGILLLGPRCMDLMRLLRTGHCVFSSLSTELLRRVWGADGALLLAVSMALRRWCREE